MKAQKIPQDIFFSMQPFWSVNKQEISFLQDESDNIVAQLLHVNFDKPYLDCVPGIGLTGIQFSTDPSAPDAYCYGVLQEHDLLSLHGLDDVFFARFLPGEFTRIFGIPTNIIPAQGIRLSEIMSVQPYVEEISYAESVEEFKGILLRMIASQRAKMHQRNYAMQQAASTLASSILSKRGDMRITEMEHETGYSARYLQKLLLEYVGATPKQLCSQIRFQQAIQIMMHSKKSRLSELALQSGYYDQSHLNREFKEYTGVSPKQFLQNQKEINW